MSKPPRLLFDLPAGWAAAELHQGSTRIDGLDLAYAGWVTTRDTGEEAHGAAIGEVSMAIEYAGYELLERCALVEAARATHSFSVKTASGVRCPSVPHQGVFPLSRRPELWNYSRSNAAAFGFDWAGACQRARWERIERDTILRSWHHRDVRMVALPVHSHALKVLTSSFEISIYEFLREGDPSGVRVVGVFLLPQSPTALPRICYGFAARDTLVAAMGSAEREALQRLAFLWGEDVDANPVFRPDADYHQEVFLDEAGRSRIGEWLGSAQSSPFSWADERSLAEERFADLSPPDAAGSYFVVRSLEARYPLYFGRPEAADLNWINPDLVLHPIA